MTNLIKAIAVLVIPFGAFFAIAYFAGTHLRAHPETLPPLLSFLSPGHPFADEALKFLGTLVIAPSIWGFFHYLSLVGDTGARFDGINGVTSLKIKPGVRLFMLICCTAICTVFVLAMMETEGTAARWLMAGFASLFIYAASWMALAKVSYDRDGLTNMNWRFARKRFPWSNLSAIHRADSSQEYHFHFEGGRKTRISTYFGGMEQLLATAWKELERNRMNA